MTRLVLLLACGLAQGQLLTAQEPLRVGGEIKPPVRTKFVPPVYPDAAKRARVQGVVIVDTTIGSEGKVTATKVLRSVPQLDNAAVTAIAVWEYKPTVVKGRAVSVIMTIPVVFSLD